MLTLKYWRDDVRASIVVFLVALPLCLGIALASNAPLVSGLIAGIIGGLVIGSLSKSPVSVSGPAAGLTVIVVNAISDLGDFQSFTLAVAIAGMIQLIFGLCRGGVIGNYFPSSVIKGMLAAIGIILMLKQFPHAVGFDSDFMGNDAFEQRDGLNTFSEIWQAIQSCHPGAIVISVFSLFLMLGWERLAGKGHRIFQLIPGALGAVFLSVLFNKLWSGSSLELGAQHLVNLPFTNFQGILAEMRFPDISRIMDPQILIVAVTLALVASLESLLSVDAADKLQGEGLRTDKNRELIAQGIGNTLSGLIGGLPITAVIVRTSANISAGAKSKLSSVLHGLWLLLCVGTIPAILNLIPLSTLATILLLVGYKLAKPSLFKSVWAKGKDQFIPFVVTIAAILFTDLLFGIGIGLLVGFFFVVKASHHQSLTMVSDGDYYLIRFHKDVSFIQKSALQKIFDKIPENASVLIDGGDGVYVDDDILEMVEEFIQRAEMKKIQVTIKKSSTSLSPFFHEVTYG